MEGLIIFQIFTVFEIIDPFWCKKINNNPWLLFIKGNMVLDILLVK